MKPAAEIVCLQLSNSFSAPASVKTTPGLPVELTIDLVDAPDDAVRRRPPSASAAAGGCSASWSLTGLIAGLLFGWISRWRVAVWRTN